MKYVLFYLPPCGAWYVHSHKLYDSEEEARDAARRFLRPGTSITVSPVSPETLNRFVEAPR